MATTDRKKQSKKSLKNARAKLKRRDEKIARLEAELKERDEKGKKKALNPMGQVLQIMEKQSQDINSRSLSSDLQSVSDAQLDAALEILLKLLK
mgnify:CR=1 FL=1